MGRVSLCYSIVLLAGKDNLGQQQTSQQGIIITSEITGTSSPSTGPVGELLIAGPMVGSYFSAAKNERAFVQIGTKKFFRTSDLMRFSHPDAASTAPSSPPKTAIALQYCGRADDYVKLGGKWVDLGETKNQVLGAGARDCCIVWDPELLQRHCWLVMNHERFLFQSVVSRGKQQSSSPGPASKRRKRDVDGGEDPMEVDERDLASEASSGSPWSTSIGVLGEAPMEVDHGEPESVSNGTAKMHPGKDGDAVAATAKGPTSSASPAAQLQAARKIQRLLKPLCSSIHFVVKLPLHPATGKVDRQALLRSLSRGDAIHAPTEHKKWAGYFRHLFQRILMLQLVFDKLFLTKRRVLFPEASAQRYRVYVERALKISITSVRRTLGDVQAARVPRPRNSCALQTIFCATAHRFLGRRKIGWHCQQPERSGARVVADGAVSDGPTKSHEVFFLHTLEILEYEFALPFYLHSVSALAPGSQLRTSDGSTTTVIS